MFPSATDLKYFLAVADAQSIRRAADRLRIAQPSLSTAIRRLEDAVGAPLFIRGKGGVQLTRAGQHLIPKARALIEDWEKICAETARDEAEVRGRYVIGCPIGIGIVTLPSIVPKLLSSHPALEIELVHDVSRRIQENLLSFKIDFGIVGNPLRQSDLVIRSIYSDEIRLWSSNIDNPAQDARSGKAVLIHDPAVFSQVSAGLLHGGAIFARTITCTNIEMVARLIITGVGVGTLTSRVAALMNKKVLRPLPNEILCVPYNVCLIYRADPHRSSADRHLAREIETALRQALS